MTLANLETARLRGEPAVEAHAPLVARLHAEAAVMATLGGVMDAAASAAWLASEAERWRRDGFAASLLFLKSTGQFAGLGGLRTATVDEAPEVELLWAILPQFQNQGLATEMACAAIAAGFSQLGLARIVAFTLTVNTASRRVMEKCGLVYERNLPRAGREHVLYAIHAPQG